MDKPAFTKRFASRFLHRIMHFLFLFLLASCVIFITGNAQNFLDSSQLIILRQQTVAGIALCVIAVSSCAFDLYFLIALREKQYGRACVFSICFFLFGLVVAVLSSSVTVLSAGVLALLP